VVVTLRPVGLSTWGGKIVIREKRIKRIFCAVVWVCELGVSQFSNYVYMS